MDASIGLLVKTCGDENEDLELKKPRVNCGPILCNACTLVKSPVAG